MEKNYIDEICPFCKEKITNESSVIVCQKCGTPHHEICWKNNNGCCSPKCKDTTEKKSCVNCGCELTETQRFCPQCGTKIKQIKQKNKKNKLLCEKCGSELSLHQRFCPVCGTKINKKKHYLKVWLIIVSIFLFLSVGTFILIQDNYRRNDFYALFPELAEKNWCTISTDGSYMRIQTSYKPNNYSITDFVDDEAARSLIFINDKLGFEDHITVNMQLSNGNETYKNRRYNARCEVYPSTGLTVIYKVNKNEELPLKYRILNIFF